MLFEKIGDANSIFPLPPISLMASFDNRTNSQFTHKAKSGKCLMMSFSGLAFLSRGILERLTVFSSHSH
jgi:hypothetical protein